MPQIEVTFDIDANGILHVSAKDLGTGKEQKISITGSSGLSKDEIDKMTRDAEAHAEEDKKAKEKIELRNNADSTAYGAEKMLKDLGDKVDAAKKTEIEDEIKKVKEALQGRRFRRDQGGGRVAQQEGQRRLRGALQAGRRQRGPGAARPRFRRRRARHADTALREPAKSDDVVDADFEMVDKDEKKGKSKARDSSAIGSETITEKGNHMADTTERRKPTPSPTPTVRHLGQGRVDRLDGERRIYPPDGWRRHQACHRRRERDRGHRSIKI